MTPEMLQFAFARFEVHGTPLQDYGAPYAITGPWYVVDVALADPEQGRRGELVGEFDDYAEAIDAFWKLVCEEVKRVEALS